MWSTQVVKWSLQVALLPWGLRLSLLAKSLKVTRIAPDSMHKPFLSSRGQCYLPSF